MVTEGTLLFCFFLPHVREEEDHTCGGAIAFPQPQLFLFKAQEKIEREPSLSERWRRKKMWESWEGTARPDISTQHLTCFKHNSLFKSLWQLQLFFFSLSLSLSCTCETLIKHSTDIYVKRKKKTCLVGMLKKKKTLPDTPSSIFVFFFSPHLPIFHQAFSFTAWRWDDGGPGLDFVEFSLYLLLEEKKLSRSMLNECNAYCGKGSRSDIKIFKTFFWKILFLAGNPPDRRTKKNILSLPYSYFFFGTVWQ